MKHTPSGQATCRHDQAYQDLLETFDVDELVREAERQGLGRDIVRQGVNSMDEGGFDDELSVTRAVERLLRWTEADYLPNGDDRVGRALLALKAAFAIGISTGIYLRPDVFAPVRGLR